MPVTLPVAPDQAPEAVKRTYDRIAETIGKGEVSVGYQMMGNVEPFLSDAYMNYRKFITDGAGKLTDFKEREAIALAVSSANNCKSCVRSHADHCKAAGWSDTQVAEILAVTATCAMYNFYFKFRDLAGDAKFAAYQVGLRAHTFVKTSLGDRLVELINIVVSNVNGCPVCTSGHVAKAIKLGVTHDEIDEAIKIAATMTAFNVFHRSQ